MLKEKTWSKELEPAIYNEWKREKSYRFDLKSKKPVYSIDTPPPYVNTPVHMGQVATYVLMDMFARHRRMLGFNFLFPLGLDRNGLPIELAAEQRFKVRLTELSREKAIAMCSKILEESSLASVESFLRCGISFNSWETGKGIGEIYLTDSPDYRALTQATFIDLWKKGLIYEDTRINNWCPGCQTTLADAEVSYEEIPAISNFVKFKVKETGKEIIIATTRPELICTCAMVIFNPEDKRYKSLGGKTAVTPLFKKEVPIRAHPMADIEKGTGLVMMCSVGDLSDIRFFREMKLESVIAINKDGVMNEHAGALKGLKVGEARKRIIEELKGKGLLVKQEAIDHRTPICERSKDHIEFIAMPEFYLKQVQFKSRMKELAKKLNFFAPESRKMLLDWINSVGMDWPISRRRFYATEIPLWYCKKCNNAFVPPKGRYYQPWKEKPPVKKCPECNSTEFRGEERVFDTWFDSSISPLYILRYGKDKGFFSKRFPCSLRPQGKEIIRTWLYYTLLKCYLLTNKAVFRDVWVNYHIVDERGKKMSKRLGNVISPGEVLDKFGAEPFRLWVATEGNLEKADLRCSFERIEGASKTLVKLWNIAKFISQFEYKSGIAKPAELDKWIIQETNKLLKLSKERYEKYDFHNPAIVLKHFVWETFASHYLELVKSRAYNGDKSTIYTLNYCLDIILRLLSPVIPMITYKIYKELGGKDIHGLEFPEVEKNYKAEVNTSDIIELNTLVWKAKKDKGLNLKSEVKELTLTKALKLIEKDIVATHNVKIVHYDEKLKVVV